MFDFWLNPDIVKIVANLALAATSALLMALISHLNLSAPLPFTPFWYHEFVLNMKRGKERKLPLFWVLTQLGKV